MKILFTRYNKNIYNKYNRKAKDEYILNIDKIAKSKIDSNISVMNQYQAFILNYEITKLLNKVLGSDNRKYNKIVYVNQNLSITSMLNIICMINKKYPGINFEYILYYNKDDEELANAIEQDIKIEKILVE